MVHDPESLAHGKRRERVFRVVVMTAFGMVLLRLFSLQVLAGNRYRELSEENRIRVEVLTAPRGEIRDRKGRLLTDNVPSFTVTIDPYDKAYVGNPAGLDSTVARLGGILGLDAGTLIAKVKKEKKQSFLVIRLKRNADLKSVAYVSEHRDELPGVEVEAEPLRRYPYGLFASHLLGYVGEISDKELEDPKFSATYTRGDLIGRMGIERQYEPYLRGVDGKRFVEVNALGRKAELLGDKRPIVPKRGADVTLSIDLDLQRAAEEAFRPGARGAIVVMDPRTGEVLALASKPNYDPNEFSTGITQARWDELSQGGNYPLFNRAIQAAYPPGSTLKPFMALAGLTVHAISGATTFREPCFGFYQFGSRKFGCWDKNGHGWLALREAIARSCDVYFYQLGLRTGLDRISEFMKRLALSERTGIDLPQERRGLFPDPGLVRPQVRRGPLEQGAGPEPRHRTRGGIPHADQVGADHVGDREQRRDGPAASSSRNRARRRSNPTRGPAGGLAPTRLESFQGRPRGGSQRDGRRDLRSGGDRRGSAG